MVNVLLLADIHIRLDELPIDPSWEYQRLILLAEAINKQNVDELWVLGDLFDKSHPTMADIIAAKRFITELDAPIKYLEGNHERISRDIYTLKQLEQVLGIEKLPEHFEVEGIGITAIGHDNIHKICELPEDDLLLSHFRWSHSIFGRGELSKKVENDISTTFRFTILGDIHYPYEPLKNVMYISSPYSINFGKQKAFGMMQLFFDKGAYTYERIPLDLPCKISTKLNLSLVNGYVDSTDPKHRYRVIVNIRHNELEKFKKLKVPKNIELIPQFIENDFEKVVKKIEVGSNIKDVLLDSLVLPTRKDRDYISGILKEN